MVTWPPGLEDKGTGGSVQGYVQPVSTTETVFQETALVRQLNFISERGDTEDEDGGWGIISFH